MSPWESAGGSRDTLLGSQPIPCHVRRCSVKGGLNQQSRSWHGLRRSCKRPEESRASRSFWRLPCATRKYIRWLSIWAILRWTTSLARKPALSPISAERNSTTIWDETAQVLPRKSEDLRQQG